MTLAWQVIDGSQLVARAAHDPAAHRIYVQLHSGTTQYYDDCDGAEWAAFLTAESRGRYVANVLAHRAQRQDLAPRPPQTGVVRRAMYLNAFRPAQELTDPRCFAGREVQVRELADALQKVGSCPLVFGDRGLGKSSLAVQAQLIAMGDDHLLAKIGASHLVLPDDATFLVLFVTCSDAVRDVDALLQLIINAAEDVVPAADDHARPTHLVDRKTSRRVSFKIFEGETARTYATGAERLGFESLSLSERLQRVVRLLSESYMTPVLVIIDELDRLRDKSGLGSLIKALSTEDLKFLLVGIAQDWSELLIDHASVERPITPIRLPRMKRAELAEIVDLAARSLAEAGSSISFNMEARTRLVDVASGFPWFVHVLGQAALMACVDDQKEVVTRDDVIRATRRLIDNSYAHLFADSYQRAVRDSAQRETTLRVLAAWKGADIPTAAAYPILKKLGVSNPTAYKGHLASENYGSVILTPGYQDRGLIRFRNEMFRQYVNMVPSLFPGVDARVDQEVP